MSDSKTSQIVLIGDSIMFGAKGIHGYGYYVKKHFEGKANVILSNDNCQDVRYTIQFLDELFSITDIENADIIHWNNGLWDVLHFAGNPNSYTSLSVYVESISALYNKLRVLNPKCKIVFATTTVIPEELQKTTSYRRNAEIEQYNQAAVYELSTKEVLINDLYAASLTLDASYRGKDGLHYTEHGSEKIASFVIKEIETLLPKLD